MVTMKVCKTVLMIMIVMMLMMMMTTTKIKIVTTKLVKGLALFHTSRTCQPQLVQNCLHFAASGCQPELHMPFNSLSPSDPRCPLLLHEPVESFESVHCDSEDNRLLPSHSTDSFSIAIFFVCILDFSF